MATTKLVDFDEALMLLEDEHDDPKMTFEPTIVPEDIEISTTLEQAHIYFSYHTLTLILALRRWTSRSRRTIDTCTC
jgi:hypothetical protein